MRILVVGSGAREHALAWWLGRGDDRTELHAAPGNPGISRLAQCHAVHVHAVDRLVGLARDLAVDLVVVGPEAPLVDGLGDALRRRGVVAFAPDASAARIEGSKTFAKDVMLAAGVRTAGLLSRLEAPCVVKADGLASGKGVFVCRTQREADAALTDARRIGGEVIVEELLEGEEVSLFALCDGRRALALPTARDFKRLGTGDTGPNTGGMGSYAPVGELSQEDVQELLDTVHRPVLAELVRRGTPFVGLLYAGLMLTADGPRVLEFNCRFGDPETQSVLPLLRGSPARALAAAAAGDLAGSRLEESDESAVTVVVSAGSYPEAPDFGTRVYGLGEAEETGALVFHAGTKRTAGEIETNGGRVLSLTGTGPTLDEARERAYAGVDRVAFAGMQFRTDIALEAAAVGSHTR